MLIQSVKRNKRKPRAEALQQCLVELLGELGPLQRPHAIIDMDDGIFTRLSNIDPGGAALALMGVDDYQQRLPALAVSLGDAPLRVVAVHATASGEHGFAPLSAASFVTALAQAGLFDSEPVSHITLQSNACVATLHTLQARDYVIRPAAEGDLRRLLQLEELCWHHTRMSRQRLRARVETNPQGQFVLEKQNQVLAAVYSQRIDDAAALVHHTAKTVHKLHTETGSIVQLLALNVDPAAQNLNFGDQLLEFTLQLCSVLPGVNRVVGVTLTKNFDANGALTFDDYIALEDGSQDPVLAFHKAHGATVVRSIPGYRPDDSANQTNGTLVSYDILQREVQGRKIFADTGGATAARPDEIAAHVQTLASQLLGVACDPEQPLMEMGLDSADLLKLQMQLEQQYKFRLPGAFFFECNTLNKVTDFLVARLAPAAEAVAPAELKPTMASEPGAGDIAIIGMSCRLPGGIDTPDDLWQALTSSTSMIGAYPASRGAWPAGVDYPGIDRGGFLADGERFDAAFFRINPHEAQVTDPQQRILLELAWACLEDAAVLPAALKGSSAGVFIGASNADYSRLVQEARIETEAHHATGGSLAILANRLSYFFDLSGPSMLIDTACSSSLVALHCAVASIRAGECPQALVGGVNFICHPSLSVAYHKAGMLSPDASCKTFDADANGYVRAEGAVMMLLKPVQQAIADGDRIHALIKGSAINHGGLAGGLTVPNPQKQSELISAAWRNAGVTPQDVSYIEAHGTGTSLGDPIEVQGIQKAYGAAVSGRTCGLGSVKSNLGHLESAAGITGLLKVILSMQHQQIPASINFNRLNPKIALEGQALQICGAMQPWDGERARIAGVSSFGSGGANAHVVVQEYHDARIAAPAARNEHLFVLSAASQERLRAYVEKVIAWLPAEASTDQFADMIYTWQAGRTALRQRLAIRADSAADLRGKLQQWLRDPGSVPPLNKGSGATDEAQLWTSGAEIDWRRAHGARLPRRTGLPTYPFGGERHWIDTSSVDRSAPAVAAPALQQAQLFATPLWCPVPVQGGSAAVSVHQVVLCEFDHIDAGQLKAALRLDQCIQLTRRAPDEDIATRYARYALACFTSVQTILASKPAGKVLFHIVAPDNEEGAVLAGLSALLKTASQENSHLIGQLILVPADIGAAALTTLLGQEKSQPGDSMVRYANSMRLVQTWQPLAPQGAPAPTAFRDDGVYLITGGLGGLGRLFTREIFRLCSRPTVILTGRNALTADQRKMIDDMAAESDGTLQYAQLGLGNPDEAIGLIASIIAQHQRLNGVIHSAGMIADNYILKKTPKQFEEVLAPKVAGLHNLDAACQHADLDFLVLFSSFASAIGNAGQADYAAANGFMDQFAAYRNLLGAAGKRRGQTLSINWPLWQDGGMSVDASSLALMEETTGMVPMATATGMTMFHVGLAAGVSQALVMEGDSGKINTLLARAVHAAAPIIQGAPVSTKELGGATLNKLKQLFGEVIGMPAGKIDGAEPLSTYGIDSIFINKLNAKLAALFGGISRTLFFEYATLADLTGYLVDAYPQQCVAWTGLQPTQAPAAPKPAKAVPLGIPQAITTTSCRQQPIAIIGVSGIYPQAPTLEDFWSNLRDGKNSVGEIPPARWSLDGFYHPDPEQAVEQGMSYSKWGGFIDQFAQFDPLFFSMSPREAMNIDPQERLFLQESWRAMENAGYTRREMKEKYQRRVGVFAGITKAGFNLYAAEAAGDDCQFFPFTSFSSAANRVSYFLDITGPSMPIDTMCSSSLTAIHEACEHISRGECELAFAGGVNLYLHPSSYTWLSSQQMLSRDGLCKSFGAGGNGYVPGEGVGVVLLKPLARAIEDGDHIHGVIIGTHVNHGGKANAYTVPSPRAQAELISRTLDKAGIRASDVSYIEAHGTGTELGDPIEFSGLQQAFGKDSEDQDSTYCKIGSAKSNIGHLESAAGIAGLTKVLLQMRHRQIAPSLHSAQLNPNIDFAGTAFQVNQQLSPWTPPQGAPRIAGISSFGAGGANAHVLVQEYIAPEHLASETGSVIVPLSARTAQQLKQRARDLLHGMQGLDPDRDLATLAYTLQAGREAMEERAAFLVDSFADLNNKLTAFLAGERDGEGAFHCQAKGNKATQQLLDDEDFADTLEKWITRRKLPKLADLWTKGLDLDWNRLYGDDKPGRIALPGYPFAANQYWVDTAVKAKGAGRVDILHPLLHKNTSDLSRQRFTSLFSGAEFFLNDHQVRGQKVLPAVAYLEMARAAVELATPAAFKTDVLELHNTVWARPLAVASATQVAISLQFNAANPGQIDFDITSDGAMLHCQGQAIYSAQTARPAIDIGALQAQMQRSQVDAGALYDTFAAMGIDYGPAHRALTAIHCGECQLLTQLTLPTALEASHGAYLMHPSMMDCALQASIALLDMSAGRSQPLMPFALDKLRVYAPSTPNMLAWVRSSAGLGGGAVKFDVDLCDQGGNVCIQMEGFSSRGVEAAPTTGAELHALAPVWSHVPAAKLEMAPSPATDKILLLGGSAAQLKWLRKAYPNAALVAFPTDCAAIEAQLKDVSFDQLLWIAPDNAKGGDIIAQQEQGVLTVFRTAKALLNLGHADKPLRWTLITSGTQAVKPGDEIAPTHAAVVGMLGSLAKEHPEWRTRLLDVDSLASITATECLSMPWNVQGDALALRAGEWFTQGLARINALPVPDPAYREGGVYVIIGGAGGIGETWSRFMAKHYRAQMIWIGRQPIGAAIEDKIRSVAQDGPAPAYFSADATDLASLQRAFADITQRFPRIHGVVNAAIVLQDQSVALMDEGTFKRALAAKVDVSVNIDKVFGDCDLDFLLYFSSLISFTKAPGQSNYAAGCTFKDSFALQQGQRYKYPVKIMNWGYWGSVGIVTSDFYNKRMQQRGVGSIQPDEAMTALQNLIGSNLNQIALMKTLERRAVDEITLAETVSIFPRTGTSGMPSVDRQSLGAPPATLKQHLLPEDMLALTSDILAAYLGSLNLLTPAARTANPLHQRWLESCTGYLKSRGAAKTKPVEQLWATWEGERANWENDPNIRAQCHLLEACLRALPDVLSGKRLATDVMFPDSSMRMVEGIYKDNALSDYYNAALGATLKACIAGKMANGQSGQIRILEIGAGTGGTTSALLPLLQPFGGAIAEYCYTDLSRAFLIHAEEKFGPRLPALRTAIFDASRPLAAQGMPENHFDFVIATNVLHATPNIRTTLRNAKAALKTQGVLLLNEMSVWSLFNHLTFGLLDGWWLYEDEALRLSGSPGLAPQKWHDVLSEVGFEHTWFPVEQAHDLGQQVIAAVSDGVVRQDVCAPVAPARPALTAVIKPATASGATLREQTTTYLQELVAATLRMAPSEIEADRMLSDYGLDSILVVGLTSQLRKVFAGITSTLFFEVQSIDGLVDYLLEHNRDQLSSLLVVGEVVAPPAAAAISITQTSVAVPVTPTGIMDVAIVGLGGRYPRAANLSQFWTRLANGDNCITEVPRERWDWESWFDPEKGKAGKIYTKWGGFIDDIDKFDPLFFKLSPKEAKSIDPQERLFLETCYHAIEDAGYTPATLADSDKLGVFVGVMNARYTTQPLHYSIANRVSYLLNFQGPSMAVDTACSASLTAIHLALESLYSGSSECAIAGGVNLIIDPVHYLELSALTMLSSGNECRSFGANADGFVDAEGVGAVVLKPLAAAERDGDHIYAVIKGSAINAGGRTNGYTVPNPKAQAAVVSQALERAKLQAWQISYIEAHGTGTALGDPIEIAGLTSAFGKTTQDMQFCAIGSLKSNIGHCESAAGIAGLTKVLLQLKHRQLAPSLHAEPANPEIDFARTPFRVQGELQEWKRPQRNIGGVMTELPRIAGISSFGAGGANAHLIVQEYDAPQRFDAAGPVAVPLSARTVEQLRQKVSDLAAFMAAEKPALAPLAYTLQVGRDELEERVAFMAHSIEELQQKLASFLNGSPADGMWRGKINRHKQTSALPLADPAFQRSVEENLEQGTVATLLDWWTQGARVNWNKLYAATPPGRISLPVYPFARERYWRDLPQSAQPSTATMLHPLLHSNVSNIRQQRYLTTFDGSPLLTGQPMNGTANSTFRVLPCAVLLEMARAAVMDSTVHEDGAQLANLAVALQQVVFADPVIVTAGGTLAIALFACSDTELDFEIYSPGTQEGGEIIHCQGHASVGAAPSPQPVDVERMRQCVPDINLPGDGTLEGMGLHPDLLEGALKAACGLLGQGSQTSLPTEFDLVQLVQPCTREMVAWARRDAEGSLDVDLCDRQGNVCVQMRGVTYETPAAVQASSIALCPPESAAPAANASSRPTKVSLAAPV